jgi:hypothetical protein
VVVTGRADRGISGKRALKYARRNTKKLTQAILSEAWEDRELDEILAEPG